MYVDLSEEKKRREKQYEKILHDYQDKRRCLATAKDNDAMRKVRHYAEDVSRYNFELAEKRVSSLCNFILIRFCFSESRKGYKV